MILRKALFDPDYHYVFFGGGGNRRIVKSDGSMILCAIVDPQRQAKKQELSLLRKDLDLPYGIDWSTGPWHLGSKEWGWTANSSVTDIFLHNSIESIDPIPTLADGLGYPLDRRDFGV